MAVDPSTFDFQLPREGRPRDEFFPETWYPGVREIYPSKTSARRVNPVSGIVAVVIHATAGGSSAGAVGAMRDREASFHWLVPAEREEEHGQVVWACAPEALAAWHVRNSASHPDVNGGKTLVNHWSLGIEIVNRQDGTDAFSDWQIEITARIVRYCWAKYPNLVDVVSHAKLDPARRSDPGVLFPWKQFQELVMRAPVPAQRSDLHRLAERSVDGAAECAAEPCTR